MGKLHVHVVGDGLVGRAFAGDPTAPEGWWWTTKPVPGENLGERVVRRQIPFHAMVRHAAHLVARDDELHAGLASVIVQRLGKIAAGHVETFGVGRTCQKRRNGGACEHRVTWPELVHLSPSARIRPRFTCALSAR